MLMAALISKPSSEELHEMGMVKGSKHSDSTHSRSQQSQLIPLSLCLDVLG